MNVPKLKEHSGCSHYLPDRASTKISLQQRENDEAAGCENSSPGEGRKICSVYSVLVYRSVVRHCSHFKTQVIAIHSVHFEAVYQSKKHMVCQALPRNGLNLIAGFHMTSLNFKLQRY